MEISNSVTEPEWSIFFSESKKGTKVGPLFLALSQFSQGEQL
jgi:hypothetical protein